MPAPVSFPWHGFLLYYVVPALVNLVGLSVASRYFGHRYTGEYRMLRDPMGIVMFSVMWPFMDGLAIVGLLFLLGSLVIAPLVRPIHPIEPSAEPEKIPESPVLPPSETTVWDKISDDEDPSV